MIKRCGLALVFLLGGGGVAAPALAQDSGVWFGGGTIATDWSAYAGAVISLPGSSLGHGWAIRPVVVGGEYKYFTNGEGVHGKYAGGTLALVYQMSGDWGWNNLSVGPRYMNTELHPRDVNNDRRGGRWDAVVSVDGAHPVGPWRLDWYGAYGFDAEDYQVSFDLTYALGDRWRLGPQIGAQGDPTYDRQTYGLLAAVKVGKGAEIQLGGGASDQSGRGTLGYGLVGFSQTF